MSAVALTVMASACGLGGDDGAAVSYADAKSTGKIKIGFANEAPWAFLDAGGELTGYAPTVARAVLKNLGINEIEGVVTDFDGLIDGLRANNYAFVAAGMFINPKRCESSDFAIPDYQVGSAFLVPRGNPSNITRFEDITRANVHVATLGGAVENGYAQDAGVPGALIEPMAKQDDILRAVRNGDVYGGAMLDVTASWLSKHNPDANLEVTQSFQQGARPDVGTFNFRLDDDEFRADFNRELRKLHESGEWLKLVEPFGLTAANEPDPAFTTEQYCAA
ncbi:ectoine/hydroxyectoine ABC transporter substrate-binding protein EhuB [Nocardia huaxiensis]|uniref:ectoine/hydroxyectoine ABC transporter substrate-binding protein EhuB n=1 Tax=Nocardia huaxiensis TaxID=2755382 RepID=UPI001E56B40A|nr:ectoine/hydroxyectoine ABC transporter substrate-binding protein EhuB [Nocardia huaxiensis]UFS97064.1 ectoine/hydroxyectoine ABC transporter substrate-binding protein EhuB [Nocardia huaxiensis]